MHCIEAVCHPIVSQAQACVGLFVLQHTQWPLCPLQHPSCSCEHLRPSQFICSGIHSERDCEQHTKQAWAPLRSENVLGSPTFLSHLAKKNKPTKAGFEVCTIWAIRRWDLWGNGSNLHVGPPFTTFDTEQEMAKALQEMASPLRQQSLIITKHCVPTVNKVDGHPT